MREIGRKRKPLIEKTSSVILKIDNEILFKLCDKSQIEFDKNAEIFNDSIKQQINAKLLQIIKEYVKY